MKPPAGFVQLRRGIVEHAASLGPQRGHLFSNVLLPLAKVSTGEVRCSVGELVNLSGMSKPVVLRALADLHASGYIDYQPAGHRWEDTVVRVIKWRREQRSTGDTDTGVNRSTGDTDTDAHGSKVVTGSDTDTSALTCGNEPPIPKDTKREGESNNLAQMELLITSTYGNMPTAPQMSRLMALSRRDDGLERIEYGIRRAKEVGKENAGYALSIAEGASKQEMAPKEAEPDPFFGRVTLA